MEKNAEMKVFRHCFLSDAKSRITLALAVRAKLVFECRNLCLGDTVEVLAAFWI